MKKYTKPFLPVLFVVLVLTACNTETQDDKSPEMLRWEETASRVTIHRDNYGVPHIYGESDADAVFGMIYAQCEDDFNRVEVNFLNSMGRLSEAEGKAEIFRDLRMKLFIDPEEYQGYYEESPEWLKTLMNAWADGINYFLHTHPEVRPKVITQFEPWMALTFSEGSIGGDIERSVSIRRLQEFYSPDTSAVAGLDLYDEPSEWEKFIEEPKGSNGISIAPKNTVNGNSLFLINPHTTFFFRPEVHMVSNEGLNAYGAVTWGQFFIYQGFNERLGWMHTSTRADVFDYYLEDIIERDGNYFYQYGEEERPVTVKEITIPYKTAEGMQEETFTTYHTHHGPIIRSEDGKWVSVAVMERPIDALRQSYGRTKAQNWDEFYKEMSIRTNSSNNTVYADADGNIGYYHGNFMPKRNAEFDWSQPVDGSNPATDWQDLHTMDEMLILKNPENGWIQNCNSTPFTAAGEYSPNPADFPEYMTPDAENFRGIHAVKVLEGRSDFTLESLKDAAYDPFLPAFELIIPSLLAAHEKGTAELGFNVDEPIRVLKDWDFTWGKESVATTLAVFWGQNALQAAFNAEERTGDAYQYIANDMYAEQLLVIFNETIEQLTEDFGTWEIPWGEVNRYQRITGDIVQDFNDDKPSIGVGFASGRWGSLAAFGARRYEGTKKMYGTRGNSFVAMVEFGEKVKAISILAGGIHGDPSSPHFDDQAQMYADGEFKEILFYKEEVEAGAKRSYQPGNSANDAEIN